MILMILDLCDDFEARGGKESVVKETGLRRDSISKSPRSRR